MTTITAEAFAMNLERYLKEALERGIQITMGGHTLRVEEAGEPLTENGIPSK